MAVLNVGPSWKELRTTVCKSCASHLTFLNEDVRDLPEYSSDGWRKNQAEGVICPKCTKTVTLN